MKILIILLIGLSVMSAYAETFDYPITIDMFVEWNKGLLASQHVTYYVQSIPSDASMLTMDIVYEAFNEWTTLNPQLEFTRVYSENEAIIVIQWVRELTLNDIDGNNELIFAEYAFGEYQTSSIIKVDMADIDCNNRIIYSSNEAIKNILKHEIGHGLGLEHSNNTKSLMYDPYDGEYDFDSLGYTIPDTIQYHSYIGLDKLEARYDKVENDFYKLLNRYGITELEWATSEDLTNAYFLDLGNEYVDEMNELAEQMNCYIEGAHDWYR